MPQMNSIPKLGLSAVSVGVVAQQQSVEKNVRTWVWIRSTHIKSGCTPVIPAAGDGDRRTLGLTGHLA